MIMVKKVVKSNEIAIMPQSASKPGSPTYCGSHFSYKEEESAAFDTLVTGMVEASGLGTTEESTIPLAKRLFQCNRENRTEITSRSGDFSKSVQSIQIERSENTNRMNIAKFSLEQRVSAQAKILVAIKSPEEDQQVLYQKVLIELTLVLVSSYLP